MPLCVCRQKGANIDEVAKDLRNQAPTALFVCCYDGEAAMRMQTALGKDAVNKTRGEGGKGAVNETRGDGRMRKTKKDNRRALARRTSKLCSSAS